MNTLDHSDEDNYPGVTELNVYAVHIKGSPKKEIQDRNLSLVEV